MCRSFPAVLMLLTGAIASCEPGSASSPAPHAAGAKPAAKAPAADPCVTIRADYFWQEQWLQMTSGTAGGGGLDPYARSVLARYKLDHPTCFFSAP